MVLRPDGPGFVKAALNFLVEGEPASVPDSRPRHGCPAPTTRRRGALRRIGEQSFPEAGSCASPGCRPSPGVPSHEASVQARDPEAWSLLPKAWAWCLVLLLGLPQVVAAHPAPFSYLDLRLDDAGVEGSLVLHDFDVAHDLGVDPPEALARPRGRREVSRSADAADRLAADDRCSMAAPRAD